MTNKDQVNIVFDVKGNSEQYGIGYSKNTTSPVIWNHSEKIGRYENITELIAMIFENVAPLLEVWKKLIKENSAYVAYCPFDLLKKINKKVSRIKNFGMLD